MVGVDTEAPGEGFSPEETCYPVWVYGTLLTEGLSIDIGEAGDRIDHAVPTPYEHLSS